MGVNQRQPHHPVGRASGKTYYSGNTEKLCVPDVVEVNTIRQINVQQLMQSAIVVINVAISVHNALPKQL